MDVLFGASFSKLEDIGKPFTRCGRTRRYLSYIAGPPVRLYNKYTETVYPLPAGGIVKQWSGRTCSIEDCNFEVWYVFTVAINWYTRLQPLAHAQVVLPVSTP
jgi:DNA topoisomerase-3